MRMISNFTRTTLEVIYIQHQTTIGFEIMVTENATYLPSIYASHFMDTLKIPSCV